MHNSILNISSNLNDSLGTGFVIDNDENGSYVATCGHVINSCEGSIFVEGKEANLLKNKYEDGIDLALLYVDGLNLNPLNVSRSVNADRALVIGYSYLNGKPKREPINDIKIKHNIVFKNKSFNIEAIKLYPDEPISNGYSGSPVICSISNQVIGIVNIQVGTDTNYAICAKHIIELHETKLNPSHNNVIPGVHLKKGLSTMIDQDDYAVLKSQFKKKLDDSLKSYVTQPIIWIEPTLHSKAEDSNDSSEKDHEVTLTELIDNPRSLFIQARQQYGLTSIAHNLVLKAWDNNSPSSFWLYLNAHELKPYTQEIDKHVLNYLNEINLAIEDIECVVLDGFSSEIKDANKLLDKISDYFASLPLIVLYTINENPLLNKSITLPQNRSFSFLNLWALHRTGIRSIVNEYNDRKFIDDEDKVVTKLSTDLEVLNIPRTPLNCLTLLKISEVDFDDDPVNRTEMIKRVLFLLFNVDDIPKYKTKPDVKDAEFVLGYFCEQMLRNKNYSFTRDFFLNHLRNFCSTSEIDLNIELIFDVLYNNNIINSREGAYSFKFSYWVFYFAAHRMHHNDDFYDFIMNDMNYSSYPEVVEFYTGIDRRRDNVLTTLTKDINLTLNKVEKNCGLPESFEIYDTAKWVPSEDQIEQMNREVREGVEESNLPAIVKDQYKDNSYDMKKPLNQSIQTIMGEYCLLRLMRTVKAGSIALRNSDYSSPEVKHKLLKVILDSWEQIVKVVLVLSPALAVDKVASLEGASFQLKGDFGASPDDRINRIIPLIPTNVVSWYRDDLFSKKMNTLFRNHIDIEDKELIKHMLCLMYINKRPKGWDKHVEQYIISKHKNSFYLYDVYSTLKAEYEYSFVSTKTLEKMEFLIKKTGAKHDLGVKNPSKTLVSKVLDSILPDRKSDD